MWWNKYVGIPFINRGRTRDGLDCWGLVRLIYEQERQIILPSYLDLYQHTQQQKTITQAIAVHKTDEWREVENPKEFDVMLLKMAGYPMHVAVCTKPGYMIHCSEGAGTVHQQYGTMLWPRSKISGFFCHE